MVYSILEANMERLEKKLTRIQNKCKRFGCSFTYEKVGEEFKTFAYNEDFDWLFIASEVLGNSSLPVGDYFWQNKAYNGYTVALLGGTWHSGSSAGGFDWAVNDASGDRGRAISGRLLYVPDGTDAPAA